MTTKNSKHFEVVRKYFKNGCLNQSDVLLSLIHYRLPYLKNAGSILKLYNSYSTEVSSCSKSILVSNYQINYSHALAMKQYLNEKLNKFILGAFLHGSLGTNELVHYSDFDALVILNHSVFQSKQTLNKAAIALKKSEQIMQNMDPLQHHGWFVITEKELDNFPINYFPPSLFEHAKCMIGENTFQIKYNNLSALNQLQSFNSYCSHLLNNIKRIEQNLNYYEVKSLLSGFMLLPSIYLQLKNPEGIFKKESFSLINKSLGDKEYEVMNQVSDIRAKWDYQPSLLYKILLSLNLTSLNYFYKKKASGRIPVSLKNSLIDMRPAMTKFIQTLLSKAKHEVQTD